MSTSPKTTMPAGDQAHDYRIKYPTSDRRPMGETDLHRQDMFDLIESLKFFYRTQHVYGLADGQLVRIEPVNGRLPSDELGLYLEQHGNELRLFDPRTEKWIPTHAEAREQAETAWHQAEEARQQAEAARQKAQAEHV